LVSAIEEKYKMIRIGLTLCILVIAPCTLCSCNHQRTWTTRVGEHNLRIIRTSLPLGTEIRSTTQGEKFTYETVGLNVNLENEVLTVNGKHYTLPNKDDSVTIIDDQVEVNGRLAEPDKAR
jgi:hypothetical protein